MKYIKKGLLMFLVFLITISLYGCWNYREIENLAIVAGLAIDKKKDNYLVTTEIVDVTEIKETKINRKLISIEGKSIFDAIRNTIKVAGKRLYFSHAEIVVISKEIAEEGIVQALDWISRDAEPRYTLNFIISKENTAKRILELHPISSDILSFELGNMLTAEKSLSKGLDIETWQLINDLSDEGISATLPTVNLSIVDNNLAPEVTGTGIFKKDKLVGFINCDDTKILMFIKNKIQGGLLTGKEYSDNSFTNISLEILKNKTTLKPLYSNNKISIEITTDTNVAIAENGGEENYIDDVGQKKLKEDSERILQDRISTFVKRIQNEYDSDIFGFGRTIKINMPDLWKEIGSRWDEVYKEVDVQVHSTINIKNSALESKPIKVGD